MNPKNDKERKVNEMTRGTRVYHEIYNKSGTVRMDLGDCINVQFDGENLSLNSIMYKSGFILEKDRK